MELRNTAFFCCLGDFAHLFQDWERHNLIPRQGRRMRNSKLTLSEMLCITVLFHLSPFEDFNHLWLHGVELKYRGYFSDLPSCGRFVALMPRLYMPLTMLLHCLHGQKTGIYIADSTKLAIASHAPILPERGQSHDMTAKSCVMSWKAQASKLSSQSGAKRTDWTTSNEKFASSAT